MQERVERGPGDAPLRPDPAALEIAGLEAREHVRLADAELLGDLRRREELGRPPAVVGAGTVTPGVACAAMPPGWFIICCAIAMPIASSAPVPATPLPPWASPCAIWYLT